MANSNRVILLTGAAGLLGFRLVEALAPHGDIIAVVHSHKLTAPAHSGVTFACCDLTDRNETALLLRRYSPKTVINCAAMTDVDGCEDKPDLARAINCGIVENILSEAEPFDTRFVQLSTDYIFDGMSGPYPEDAVPNPVNVYGRTKLEAEQLVNDWPGSKLIVRTSALYDCLDSGKANLFASTYCRLRRSESVVSASDAYCNPIWTQNLAHAVAEAASTDAEGVLNVAGPVYLSRYDFSLIVATKYGFAPQLVRAAVLGSMGRRASRPLLAGLDSSKAISLLNTRLLSPLETLSDPLFQPAM
jgi:dTDP-4-dehydrorhamnose reductase